MIFLIPFRNRDTQRLAFGLQSLTKQTDTRFSVKVIDYGSDNQTALALKKIISAYDFCEYLPIEVQGQLWNKSKALNIAIKSIDEGYVFIADADLLYAPDFVEKSVGLAQQDRAVYFKVGFLSEDESKSEKTFAEYKVKFNSEKGATGLTLFPVKALHEVGGFDEFFHFWGAEDTDIHNRLTLAGYTVDFYDKEVLLLHQWHPIYRAGREGVLTAEPRLTNVVRLNHQHLQHNLQHQIINPNGAQWGQMPDREKAIALQQASISQTLTNSKEMIDHFLYCEWPNHKGLLAVRFTEDHLPKTPKYRIKKALGKSVPQYYTLKEINDLILMQLISAFRNCPYTYSVDLQQRCILLKIFL